MKVDEFTSLCFAMSRAEQELVVQVPGQGMCKVTGIRPVGSGVIEIKWQPRVTVVQFQPAIGLPPAEEPVE